MSPALVISKREIRTYFNSPVAYIVVTVFTIVFGFFFFNNVFVEKQADMRGFFSLAPLMFCFFAPAITMRLLAEEKGSGTIEILITMPVRDWEVVVGKWLGGLVTYLAAIAFTVVYVVLISVQEPTTTGYDVLGIHLTLPNLDYGGVLAGYVGLLLVGGAWIAVGLLA